MSQKLLDVVAQKVFLYLFILSSWLSLPTYAEDNISPTITIIIDDLGYRYHDDQRVLELPGPVAFSILPHGPNTDRISRLAIEQGREMLLHQPMQAIDSNKDIGPGGLTLNMERDEFIEVLETNLRRVPNIIGLNNHMGSLLTRHSGHMQWLMETLKMNGYLFIDSMTSSKSVAANVARDNNLPYLTRDVFLDHVQSRAYVREKFMELVDTAKRKGSALAIGHPHPETIEVLAEMLVDVEQYGVNLVGLRTLYARKHSDRQYAQKSTDTTRAGL